MHQTGAELGRSARANIPMRIWLVFGLTIVVFTALLLVVVISTVG